MDRSPGFLGSKPREAQLYFTNIALTTCAESMAMWLCACSPFKNVVMSRIHPKSSWKWYNKHGIWKQPRYYFFFFPLQIFSFVVLFFLWNPMRQISVGKWISKTKSKWGIHAARQVKNKVGLTCASFAGRPIGNSTILTACTLIYCQLEGAILCGIWKLDWKRFPQVGAARLMNKCRKWGEFIHDPPTTKQ